MVGPITISSIDNDKVMVLDVEAYIMETMDQRRLSCVPPEQMAIADIGKRVLLPVQIYKDHMKLKGEFKKAMGRHIMDALKYFSACRVP